MRRYELCWGLGFILALVGAGCLDSDKLALPLIVLAAGIGVIGLGFIGSRR